MDLCVVPSSSGHRLSGDAGDVGTANRFLEHLSVRNFSPATRRAYTYDLLNFLRFLRMTTPSGPTVLGRIPAVVATLWLSVGLEIVAVSGSSCG